MKRTIDINPESRVRFHNGVDFCVGTGRMGLALQKEYQEQLKLVQDVIGFKHIRGHGLFCDDMAIYQESMMDGEVVVEYNFTYLDMVMDSYINLGLKPFIELGFMPYKMARGTQTVFYWKGNTTPPKSYDAWRALVQATLHHLMERYGADEVVTWPVEVWNEPNLRGFWENADMPEYFRLFKETFEAVKEVDSRFRVGGPAVCGGSDRIWIRAFMEFCKENKIPVDFVTRHHYATELPDYIGHYGYVKLHDQETNQDDGFTGLQSTRDIVDSFPEYKDLEIHVTEFNTSYIPNCSLHDTNQNAAYIAHMLSRMGDWNESYSYWTFGDIFEEKGVPFTPFHGGFGLVANGCIPKPTFWTFAFFKQLKEKAGHCVYRDENCVVMKTEDGEYRGVCWNMTQQRSGRSVELNFNFDADTKNYALLTKRVDEEGTNPLKVWHDLGEPANLNAEQTKLLQMAAQPRIGSEIKFASYDKLNVNFTLEENAVVYFELAPRKETVDLGYSYERTMQFPNANPLTRTDYPDPDIIRVDDTYYMVSTTMYFMPGCEILRSYDLVHWEHVAFVYDRLDSTPAQCLKEGNAYSKGMWAACLRYHKGKFYVCFVANDTQKTYLFTADKIDGPWEKRNIEGFYHDCSLLFDDDGRNYIVYGNRTIYLTELKEDLSGPKPGGLHRVVLEDTKEARLGYEGTHMYKISGKYYLFFIHSLASEWKRTEACFMSDSLEGEFVGGDILNDDMGYCNSGVAQGGIVDTPDGKWYAILFQDRGAVGRIPVLVPMTWEEDYPVLGVNGRVPLSIKTTSTRPDYEYEPLFGSDDFKGETGLSTEVEKCKYGSFGFKSFWQFNHEPELSLVHHDKENGMLWLETDSLCDSLVMARNTLTQRMLYPGCAAEVTLDISKLKDGDYAGLCALQSCYGFVAVTKRDGKAYIVMQNKAAAMPGMTDYSPKDLEKEWEAVELEGNTVTLKVVADFTNMKDTAKFLYKKGWSFEKIGVDHKMYFKLDHFTGYRFGLFMYSTKESGGQAGFSNFIYKER